MARSLPTRCARQDVIVLLALCAVTLFVGLTSHGLSNWQEAMRALVAQNMGLGAGGWPNAPGGAGRVEWIVPTVNGEPYLAKPPMIYWCQLAIAQARRIFGGEGVPGILELRLTVALAATLGVIATYLVTRRLFGATAQERAADPIAASSRDAFAGHAAWWSALFLGTGFLYVRSGRTGELDVLLAPLTVIGIGALFVAWMGHVERQRMHWGALALAGVAVAAAALTKGPPGVVTILLGAYGGMALASANASRCTARAHAIGAAVGGLALGVPMMIQALTPGGGVTDATGVLLIAIAGAMLGAALAPLARRRASASLFAAWSRTHPVGMILIAVGAAWAWSWLVSRRVGADVMARTVSTEASNNLVLFEPESILQNLEAASYAAGLGSVFAALGAIWLVTRRPQGATGAASRGLWFVIAWVGLGLLAFSLLGKGVARYMTPLWPGIAILGGAFVATLLTERAERPRVHGLRMVLSAIVVVLAIGQGVWYGVARERLYADRHPGGLIAELESLSPAAPPIILDYWSPALDFYAGVHIQPYADVGPEVPVSGVRRLALEALHRELAASGGSRVMLIRSKAHKRTIQTPPIERLREAGFEVTPIETEHAWIIDNRETPIMAVRVSAAR